MPTKKESEDAQKIVDEAKKNWAKIEAFDTYGMYDTVAVVKGTSKEEKIYLRYLHAVKEWADVQTMVVIEKKLHDKVDKKFLK